MTHHGIDQVLTSSLSTRKNTPCCLLHRLHGLRSPTLLLILFFDFMVMCVSLQWEEEYSQRHATQTFPVHPHRNSVPVRAQGGESRVCYVPGTNWAKSKKCSQAYSLLCVFGKFVFDPAVLGMPEATTGQDWRKSSRTEGGRAEKGRCTEVGICCGIPEFPLRSVFGTQLSGIWLILPARMSPSISAYFAL